MDWSLKCSVLVFVIANIFCPLFLGNKNCIPDDSKAWNLESHTLMHWFSSSYYLHLVIHLYIYISIYLYLYLSLSISLSLSIYIYIYNALSIITYHFSFFYLGFLLRSFTNQRTTGERRGHLESSPLHTGSRQTRTGNLWFPSASR